MPRTERLSSPANPLLREIRRASARGEMVDGRLWIAEGFHLLEEARRSGVNIPFVLATQEASEKLEASLKPGPLPDTRVMILSEALFQTIATTETSQQVLALIEPSAWQVEHLFSNHPLLVVLDGLQDPGNAGTIVRAAEAFGATGVAYLKGSVSPWNPKALRASAGSSFRVPSLTGVDSAVLFTELRSRRTELWAAMPWTEGVADAESASFAGPAAIVIGSEGKGVSPKVRSAARPVGIRTAGVESLNAATAAAILLYEASPAAQNEMSLFEDNPLARHGADSQRPLADRMRPQTLDQYAGQEHILGPGKPLRMQIERDQLTSIILWGPPGVGKTTLAQIIAHMTHSEFLPFSAVLSGIKEIKAVMADAERLRKLGRRTILFVDEIHRFNKAQQDAFLPYVEKGDIILIGATTENPSFEVNAALLSRSKVYMLRALTTEEVAGLLRQAVTILHVSAEEAVLEQIAAASNGDARSAYNTLEVAASAAENGVVTETALADVLGRKVLLYDKSGEEHFNLISALHKSVRSSQVDAALYWLARMLEAGEDRMYIARRVVRMAIEDIGLADPRALEQCMAMQQAVHFLGIPEGDLALAQAVIYLAIAPKSDASYKALGAVSQEVRTGRSEPVPMHLRNAPTKAMKEWGYSAGYQHAHDFDDARNGMECLPPSLAGREWYFPTDRGVEKRIAERLADLRRRPGEA